MAYCAKSAGRRPTGVDKTVGANVKKLRKRCGMTQCRLGEAIGLSFKQIRKYEAGDNRISASVLFGMSVALDVPIEAFYEGIPMVECSTLPIASSEARELGALFSNIDKPAERRAFLRLVKEISKSQLFSPCPGDWDRVLRP